MAGGSRRFEFGWLEVFGLIVVFAAGSVVVFFLGVFVGKGLQESRLAREERVVRLPIDPVAANVGARAKKPPRPVVAPDRVAPAPAVQPTSSLQLAVHPAPSPTEAVVRPSPVATAVPRPTEPAVVVRPTPSPEPVRVAAIPTASPRARPKNALIGSPRGKWSVQVNATKDAYTARKIVQDLRRRGYNAYAVEVQLRGEVWYRVRVGRFPTMQDATAMVVRLKNAERYSRAFLVEE